MSINLIEIKRNLESKGLSPDIREKISEVVAVFETGV